MKNLYLIVFSLILLMPSCARKFTTVDYDRYYHAHAKVALLPYEIIITGRMDKKLSETDIENMMLEESKLYQNSLYNYVLKKSGNDKDEVGISIQSLSKTNSILLENGITTLNISEYSSQELGELLGVDAIFRATLYKERFLSKTEGFLADTAIDVAESVLGGTLYNQKDVTKTSKTTVYATIDDVVNEVSIWHFDKTYAQDWTDDIDRDIAATNDRIAKHFPYRNQ